MNPLVQHILRQFAIVKAVQTLGSISAYNVCAFLDFVHRAPKISEAHF
jgi:hypothetical protein